MDLIELIRTKDSVADSSREDSFFTPEGVPVSGQVRYLLSNVRCLLSGLLKGALPFTYDMFIDCLGYCSHKYFLCILPACLLFLREKYEIKGSLNA